MEDEKIMGLYWDRDEEALRLTNEKYGSFCFAIANNILRSEEDSEACVNDTWFQAWLAIPPQRPSFFKAFLGRITRSLSLDRCQRSRAAKHGGELDAIYEELGECIGTEDPDAAETLARSDALGRFLQGISHDSRIVFVRRYWFADSVKQIAQRYGMDESKVKSSLMRSRARLRQFLEEEGITA